MANHHNFKVLTIDGTSVPVDLRMVPVVQRLNDLGYSTKCSCEHINHGVKHAHPMFNVGIEPIEDGVFIGRKFAEWLSPKSGAILHLKINAWRDSSMVGSPVANRIFIEGSTGYLPLFEQFVLTALPKKEEM